MYLSKNLPLYKIKGLSYFHKNPQKYREQEVRKFLFDKLLLPRSNNEKDSLPSQSTAKIPVWIFWAQGFDSAPLFIKENLRHTKKLLSSDYVVHPLDLNDVLKLVNVPNYILDKYYSGKIKQAFFSDVVRFYLLDKFGGLWLDATVYLTQNEIPNDIRTADHFIFQDSRFSIDDTSNEKDVLTYIPGSSWLIFFRCGDSWVSCVCEALNYYLENFNTISYYYTTHLIMGMFFETHPEWYKEMPKYDNQVPHMVQNLMSKPYDANLMDKALDSSFAHKLSYKQVYYSENDKKLFMDKLFKIIPNDEEKL